MNKCITAAGIAAFLLAVPASSFATSHSAAQHAAQPDAQETPLTEGEVRRVDKAAKKLTIRHGAIANLDMPPMTMVFQVQDPAVLDTVKAGDKIRFNAEKSGGAYTVTRVEAAP